MKRTTTASIAAALLFGASMSFAQTDKALALFNVGAAAYKSAHYVDAIRAFEDAYKAEQRPGIMFSLAQAHRRQYPLDHDIAHVHTAVKLYREYLAKVGEGGRRADAAEALAELDAIEQRAGTANAAQPQATPPPPPAMARLMGTTDVKGAMLIVDSDKPKPFPYGEDIKPGKHKIRVVAEGYFDFEREIDAPATGVVPLDPPLKEKPATIVFRGDSGVEIAIDGRPSGTTPLPAAIELPAGRHFVAMTHTGFKSETSDFDVKRGETKTMDVSLSRTGQRYASYILVGAGTAGIAVGAVMAGLAVHDQSLAQQFLDKKSKGNVTQAELDDYNKNRDARDNLKRYASVAAGAGLVVGITGALLYVFDRSPVALPSQRVEDRQKPETPSKPETQMEVGVLPAFGPGYAGGAMIGRF